LLTRHVPLVTASFDEAGDAVEIKITCDQCDGGRFALATAHIATVASTLIAVCGAAGISLSRPVTLLDLGSVENLRAAQERYAQYAAEKLKKT
jgi:hypothetical protein